MLHLPIDGERTRETERELFTKTVQQELEEDSEGGKDADRKSWKNREQERKQGLRCRAWSNFFVVGGGCDATRDLRDKYARLTSRKYESPRPASSGSPRARVTTPGTAFAAGVYRAPPATRRTSSWTCGNVFSANKEIEDIQTLYSQRHHSWSLGYRLPEPRNDTVQNLHSPE